MGCLAVLIRLDLIQKCLHSTFCMHVHCPLLVETLLLQLNLLCMVPVFITSLSRPKTLQWTPQLSPLCCSVCHTSWLCHTIPTDFQLHGTERYIAEACKVIRVPGHFLTMLHYTFSLQLFRCHCACPYKHLKLYTVYRSNTQCGSSLSVECLCKHTYLIVKTAG